MIGKRKTKLYLKIKSMIESGASHREIKMATGSADNYIGKIRKSLKDPK